MRSALAASLSATFFAAANGFAVSGALREMGDRQSSSAGQASVCIPTGVSLHHGNNRRAAWSGVVAACALQRSSEKVESIRSVHAQRVVGLHRLRRSTGMNRDVITARSNRNRRAACSSMHHASQNGESRSQRATAPAEAHPPRIASRGKGWQQRPRRGSSAPLLAPPDVGWTGTALKHSNRLEMHATRGAS